MWRPAPALCLLLAGLMLLLLLPSPISCDGCYDCYDPPPNDCTTAPTVAVTNGGVWPTEEKNKGENLIAICPFGISGPYVTCTGKAQWSELRGGLACPGDANSGTCAASSTTTEAVTGGVCRCKAGLYRSGSGTGASLTCLPCDDNTYSTPGLATSCTTCPDSTEPTQDKGACKCVAGKVPKAGTAWEQGTLVCEGCPPGYFVAVGASRCSACSGYYEYSAAGATTCATCPIDSYANAEHTGCQCNAGCTPQGSGLTLRCSCPVSFALYGAYLITSSGGSCSDWKSGLEGQGSICQCKAGLRQSGTFDLETSSTLTCAGPPSYDDAAGNSGCSNNNAYALPGFTACRTCPVNSVATAAKDGCICDAGHVQKATTSLQANNMQCDPCPPGKYASLLQLFTRSRKSRPPFA